ncbi:MAG TPA: OmpA family protein, partial [Steroidobacteraceae bacterium]|nr:OmpA family protein [Steroidobacteraceae bacterium]
VSQDAVAQQVAGEQVQEARNALDAADRAFEAGKLEKEVAHLAYVAGRNAQLANAIADEQRARQQIARGEAERNRVLLEARTREAEQATGAARAAQASAEARTAEAEEARAAELAARSELEALQAKQTERGIVITLGDVLFDTGAATLKPGADLAMDRLARFLEANPQVRVIIEGHADSRGTEAFNEALSQRRADAVAQALAVRNVTGERVHAMGRGEGYPVASNRTNAGRQQNRRVEIVFSDASGRFAQQEDERAGTLR